MRVTTLTLLFLAAALVPLSLRGETLVSYDFGSLGEPVLAPGEVAEGIEATPIMAGAGMQDELAEFTVSEGHAVESGHSDAPHLWVTDDDWSNQANAGTTNNLGTDFYFSFTVTPQAGESLTLSSLTLDAAAGSTSSMRYLWVYSSVTGFGSNEDELAAIEIDATQYNLPAGSFGSYTVTLDDPAFENVTGPVEFRFYYGTNWYGGAAIDNIGLHGPGTGESVEPFDERSLSDFERDAFGHYIVPTGSGRVFEVGPDQEYEEIGDVPMQSLQAGDTVRLHWRPAPYHEKVLLGGQGTPDEPIVFVGVPNESGKLPVIDGENATTRPGMRFGNEDRGVVTVEGGSKPMWIYLANLNIRGGRNGNTFTDSGGDVVSYENQAAGVNVVRGEFIHILNCTVTECGNGIFNASYVDEDCIDSWCADGAYISSDLLIEGCTLYGNGYDDRMFEHNIYIENLRPIVQYNYIGSVRDGSLGSCFKDRSSGLVLRYNWIEGARPVDLVETEYGGPDLYEAPEYEFTLLYGNVIIKTPGSGNDRIIHYGGDHPENFDRYRKKTLYLYHNTIISRRAGSSLFGLSTEEERAVVHNNLLYFDPEIATTLYILDGQGELEMKNNWIREGYTLRQNSGGLISELNTITGADPGFVDYASDDFHLIEASSAAGMAGDDPEALFGKYSVQLQYLTPTSYQLRGDTDDVGAFATTDAVYLFFRDTVRAEDAGWFESATFGVFWGDDFPWIYSEDHRWWWCDGPGVDSMWFYDYTMMSWWWSGPAAYPWVWDYPNLRWICYLPGSRDPRRFWDLSSLEWITADESDGWIDE